jgi:ABC-type nitrate/sulfonate/bicarbonate transport system substrate-binding protein
MPGKKNVLFVIISILLCFASNVSAQDRTRIALSVRNVVLLPFYYAKDRQIFDKNGLYVEIVQMRSDLQMAGVASGEIDFAAAVGSAVQAIVSGMPLKIVGILYHGSPFSLVGSAASAPKDLKGKKVAVSRIGSESHKAALLMLEKSGVDVKKVTFLQTGSTTVSMIALQQSSVDAAVLSPPFTGEMVVKGFKVLQRSRGLAEVPSNGLVTSREKIQKQPQKVSNLLKSMLESLRLIRQDKPGVVEYIRKNFSVPQRVAEEAYDDLLGVMLPDMIWPEDRFKNYLESGYVRTDSSKPVSVGDVVDYSLLRALKQ